LFYTTVADGTVVAVLQLMDVIGNFSRGDTDVVTQHIKQDAIGIYAEVVGYCVNSVFMPPAEQDDNRL